MRNFVNGGASLVPSSTNHDLESPLSAEERLFTAQEVADRLGVSERWVRDHATRRKPRLRAIKLGPLLRFRWPDVQALVAQLATEKPFNRGKKMVQ